MWQAAYFREWRHVRWLILLLVPVLVSSSSVLVRGHSGVPALVVAMLGGGVAVFMYVFIASGVSTSNHGMYLREKQPVRYWLDVSLLAVVYGLVCVAGFFIGDKPSISSPPSEIAEQK